jgi:NAD dependent epimerase/dehydratase
MNLKGKNVLVTGAGGFIGSHLVEALVSEGAHVRAFVHYNSRNDWGNLELVGGEVKKTIEVVSGDVRDPFFTRAACKKIDVVFHLAALIPIPYSYLAPKEFVDTNVVGTLNIMQAAKDENVAKIVHTSTSETYGTAQYTPIDEKHPLQGQSPYSASKIGADKIAESYFCSFETPVAVIRPFNTYGPRQSARAVIPSIACQLAAGRSEIKVGSLSPVRDMTYISDTIQGFLAVAKSEKSIGQVINIGSGRGVPIAELARQLIELSGKKARLVEDKQRIRPDKSEVLRLICDHSKAARLLGWEPAIPLETGLAKALHYVEENQERYKADIYNV